MKSTWLFRWERLYPHSEQKGEKGEVKATGCLTSAKTNRKGLGGRMGGGLVAGKSLS